jgi:hypothetical protein
MQPDAAVIEGKGQHSAQISSRTQDRRTSEAQQNDLKSKDNSGEQLRSLVRGLKVHLLTTTSRDHTSEFEPNAETSEGKRQAQQPHHECGAHAANTLGDGGWRGEDPGAYDATDTGMRSVNTVDNQEPTGGLT